MPDATHSVTTLAARLCAFDSATVYQAAGHRGAMPPGIQSLTPGKRVAGPVLTVICPPGDNLMLHSAVAAAQAGEIIVAQCHDVSYGVWGEVLTVAAMARGVVALVIDGSVRDIDSIRELGFPVFARGTALSTARKSEMGCLRVPTTCGGLLIWPTDYLIADDSGLVTIPGTAIDTTIAAAAAHQEREQRMMDSVRAGQTTVDLLELKPVIARRMQEQQGALP
jgi:4-hydroxy-4-methyl-2-oxoglutarate aldolase